MNVHKVFADAIVWDNHACMPIRAGDVDFLPQLERHRKAGATLVSLNVHFGQFPWPLAFEMLATFRHWIQQHPSDYLLVESVADIHRAKANKRLGIVFDIEGGLPVEPHIGMVELFYRLGVRWLLLAYNRNNMLGGGCQDEDMGLTDYGRQVIDEMRRVGMVLCCSHTGYRTVREAIEYSRNPVIFSHSNPRGLVDHPRNIPDDLITLCASAGGVVNVNGFGVFLGSGDISVDTFLDHVDYVANLAGAEHVGIGLDYVFDIEEMNQLYRDRPDLFPPGKGYRMNMPMLGPESLFKIADGLARRGYGDAQIQGVLGQNNLRVASQVWK